MFTYSQKLTLKSAKIGVVNWWVILLTFSLFIIGLIGIQLPNSVQLGLFILLIIITGIPHGATDHWVYHYFSGNDKADHPYNSRFFAYYLGTMAFYAFFWFIFPQLSLLFFLLLSAYHFGQSQLYYLNSSENHWVKILIYMLWGTMVLLEILSQHQSESYQILSILITKSQWNALVDVLFSNTFKLGLSACWISLLIWAESKHWLSFLAILKEIVLLVLLFLFVRYTSLLLAFGVYFSLWHAIQSIQKEIKEIRKINPYYNLKKFVIHAIPFSLISFIGIGFLLAVFYQLSISPYLIFFIIISILTLPHMLILQKIYHKNIS